MPPLKYILQNSNVDELNTLRGKTIECISLIGLAVGKEKVCFSRATCSSFHASRVYNSFSEFIRAAVIFFHVLFVVCQRCK